MLRNMKQIRLTQGFTLQKLSNATGMSTTYLNDLENGKRSNPSYINMNKLLDVLKVSTKELEGR